MISRICSWIVRHADMPEWAHCQHPAPLPDPPSSAPHPPTTEGGAVDVEILVGLQARVGTLENWLSSQTGSFNLKYVHNYLQNHIDAEIKKLFEKTQVGKLSARQDALDAILASNADYHRREMAELRWRISRVDLDKPVTPAERRVFVKLCLRLGEVAERMKAFADSPTDTHRPISEEPAEL